MKPHPRIRKTIKWGGVVVTALLLIWWASSTWWSVGWIAPSWSVGFTAGRVGFACQDFEALGRGGVIVHRYRVLTFPWEWWPRVRMAGAGGAAGEGAWSVSVPFWILALAAIGATITAWRLDTRARRQAGTHPRP